MGGLAVLFFIGLYFVIAFKVVGKFKASHYKWLVVALIVLIPSGDAMVGRAYLKYLCAKEGGLKVYRVAEHVEGFMEAFENIDDDWVKNGGYQFSESTPVNGLVTRYSRQNGQIIREDNVMPQSRYRVRLVNVGQKDVYGRSIDSVETVGGLDVLATYTAIAFKGGWVERFLAQFSDSGVGNVAFCGESPTALSNWNSHQQVVIQSLKK